LSEVEPALEAVVVVEEEEEEVEEEEEGSSLSKSEEEEVAAWQRHAAAAARALAASTDRLMLNLDGLTLQGGVSTMVPLATALATILPPLAPTCLVELGMYQLKLQPDSLDVLGQHRLPLLSRLRLQFCSGVVPERHLGGVITSLQAPLLCDIWLRGCSFSSADSQQRGGDDPIIHCIGCAPSAPGEGGCDIDPAASALLVEALVRCGSDRPLPLGAVDGLPAKLTIAAIDVGLSAEQMAACRQRLLSAGRGPELVCLTDSDLM
jgi:hypothetical protein